MLWEIKPHLLSLLVLYYICQLMWMVFLSVCYKVVSSIKLPQKLDELLTVVIKINWTALNYDRSCTPQVSLMMSSRRDVTSSLWRRSSRVEMSTHGSSTTQTTMLWPTNSSLAKKVTWRLLEGRNLRYGIHAHKRDRSEASLYLQWDS